MRLPDSSPCVALALTALLGCGASPSPTSSATPTQRAAQAAAPPPADPDGDRIAGDCDLCPDVAEVYNGYRDDDGCPESGRVAQEDRRVFLPQRLAFARGSSALDATDGAELDALAAGLTRPDFHFDSVTVVGVSAPGERDAERLARARADSVRQGLVDRGVDAARLQSWARGTHDPFPTTGVFADSLREPPYVGFALMGVDGFVYFTWDGDQLRFTEEQPPDPSDFPDPGPASCPRTP